MELNTYIFDSERYLCCEFGIKFLLEDIPFEALNNLILKQRNLFSISVVGCRCVEKMCCERYQSAVIYEYRATVLPDPASSLDISVHSSGLKQVYRRVFLKFHVSPKYRVIRVFIQFLYLFRVRLWYSMFPKGTKNACLPPCSKSRPTDSSPPGRPAQRQMIRPPPPSPLTRVLWYTEDKGPIHPPNNATTLYDPHGG